MSITAGTRVVLIGGTSGIGLATAKAVTAAGASVVVASDNPATTKNALAELPDRADGQVADAASSES
ncbi:SDR family NAD(P)-dependent oxidoreductase [Pseudofrankia asymbiotica]|uniref:Short-chain dehydrogenase n=1 Tax=Pseudofrankia asymbiotica TaxID=1834516 RepID=A0A1V2HZX4_9ACTN|nr:SDR family NAD(P)-dependent oxidoreductase [Pseudofrankia asymbiotica]ONH22396.1 hypothetical protein BL253_35795 [Pseudofrankia asymbiotica]